VWSSGFFSVGGSAVESALSQSHLHGLHDLHVFGFEVHVVPEHGVVVVTLAVLSSADVSRTV